MNVLAVFKKDTKKNENHVLLMFTDDFIEAFQSHLQLSRIQITVRV